MTCVGRLQDEAGPDSDATMGVVPSFRDDMPSRLD